jgi:hypothetical protein
VSNRHPRAAPIKPAERTAENRCGKPRMHLQLLLGGEEATGGVRLASLDQPKELTDVLPQTMKNLKPGQPLRTRIARCRIERGPHPGRTSPKYASPSCWPSRQASPMFACTRRKTNTVNAGQPLPQPATAQKQEIVTSPIEETRHQAFCIQGRGATRKESSTRDGHMPSRSLIWLFRAAREQPNRNLWCRSTLRPWHKPCRVVGVCAREKGKVWVGVGCGVGGGCTPKESLRGVHEEGWHLLPRRRS